MAIELTGVSKSFDGRSAVFIPRLTLPDKGIFGVRGASGCGKTTLLRLLAGLEKPDSGEITGLEGKKLTYVFQEDRLLPSLNAKQNIEAVCDAETASLWLERVGLGAHGGKYPDEMSGGMCRRVAFARAFAYGGDVVLLDEPFKGLDAEIKARLADFVCEKAKKSLVILVTHDGAEAELSGDFVNLPMQ